MKTYFKPPRPGETSVAAACPICGCYTVRQFWRLPEYSFQRCTGCGHVYQNPRPSPLDLVERYDEDYKQYEVDNADNFFNLMRLGLDDVGFSGLEASLPPGKRALDVGCATGMLVAALEKRGWQAEGVEVCQASADYGRATRGVTIHVGTLDSLHLPAASFDLVHSSHVIEHVSEPGAFLREMHRILKPGGYLVCATPNLASYQARRFGTEWRSAIADHVHLFSLRSLRRLIRQCGFQPLRHKTWGGIALGLAPPRRKACLDRWAKRLGFGDVQIQLARKPLVSGISRRSGGG
ncbi:MAG: hypothetical protein A2087_02975 [Spirochaetes bacterium GWD1_61_31]|nr:MAG: hypothetical protein A2Y37_14070 [Spirochaetes bacterium GWB1_60_80]OHD34732.1 MAG: hypothetical protein A2004_00185 [Spirochaetes bacterium GWC1_61_12]OHD38732.1 MAG: hypothetical protein A2087_02975 [Spirochaetes bacterium GWD1_61_31]OHD44477.1 MAG: hypothetical protein A2Y35_04910 [Spirochaetes bacterium GWE1_60_18]OHD59373.1 MAG: hypothetical protein A2Y32_08585 [Spirochaetes bacterium GWF1_60_12]HAP43127.1 hypothetical protein [Spirochaetaceae bacterium]